jgi:hypothetical protein
MSLENLLSKRKAAIVKKWFNQVVLTYPADAANFLKNQKDPFANPVGRKISKGLEALFDALLQESDDSIVESFLDPIIRIRAVQNFSPSQATAFIFSLKNLIREDVHNEIKDREDMKALLTFESKIDNLGLIAFDIYMKCREKIYQIKSTEEKNRTFSAFRRAGLICEITDDESDTQESNFNSEVI